MQMQMHIYAGDVNTNANANANPDPGDVACLVNVKPMIHEDAANAERVALDVLATLTPSAPWVRVRARVRV